MTDATLLRLEAVTARLEAVAARMGRGGGGGGGGGYGDDDEDVPFWVGDYENIVKKEVAAAVQATNGLKIPKMGDLLQKAYQITLELIQRAPNTKKPSNAEMMAFLKPGIDAIGAADTLKYKGKNFKKFGDHYKAMYEAILVISWVTMAPPMGLPAQHVEGQLQSCDFNLTRIQRRDKDPQTKAWISAMKALNLKVKEFVKSNFKSGGLTWNPKGGTLSNAAPVSAGKSSSSSNSYSNSNSNSNDDQKQSSTASKSKKPAAGGMGDVFSQLQKGTGITKGMKKVTKNMKTKYRSDRSGKVVMKQTKRKGRKKFGPPQTVYRGGRWMIENYDNGVIEVDKPTLKQNLFISMCDTCTVNVTATKVKAVCVDSCVKVRVFVNDVVSSVELVNCKSVTIVLQGVSPSVTVDKCESAELILSAAAFAAPPVIITSNISAMNISLPAVSENDDQKHIPVPEQFLTTINNETRSITTVATEH